MYFPKFWARAKVEGQCVWRWSEHSEEDARRLAQEAAARLADRIRNRDWPLRERGYYPGRPFREPVLREMRTAGGELAAVVTRNSYGCLVLNTARCLFVDVDFPAPKEAAGFFKRLFGRTEPPPEDPSVSVIAGAERWAGENRGWGWRIYRTRAGLRLLATHDVFDPERTMANGVFDRLGADPLYRQLCQAQKCFRARLTPKPWRCGIHHKPTRWPWLNPKAQKQFEAWEQRYLAAASKYATCELVRASGNPEVHPEIQPILALHDESTRVGSRLPLA